ncbi:unnamed protein product, partial [Polarella glacialis]
MATPAPASRLKYEIIKCTSEDPEFPVSELLTHTSQTKGWQTARFCEFPQEVCLQFESPVHLRQVQFLSHQSKIATKIELFTALQPPAGAIVFKRLGYLSLDSNERSQFQARELKSVYVDVPAQFLRILFHKCHINRYNIVNQVGLIALSCLGEVLDPQAAAVGSPEATTIKPALSSPSASPSAASAPASPAAEKPEVASGPPLAAAAAASRSPPAALAPAPRPKVPGDLDDVDESKYDVRTLEKLKSLAAEKQRFIDNEDYEGAKRCKEMLTRLKQTGLKLRELEMKKRDAVENEEYDLAKSLKAQIDALREGSDAPSSARTPTQSVPAEAPTPATNSGRQQRPPPPNPAPEKSERPSARPGHGGGGYAEPLELPRTPSQSSTAAPPRSSFGGGLPVSGRDAEMARGGPYGGDAGVPNGQPPRAPQLAGAHNPLAGVAHAEDLGQPEPLAAGFENEAGPLYALFGEYIVNCIYSKTWSLRDAALQKLSLQLRGGSCEAGNQDIDRLLHGYATILTRTVADKNVQVFNSSATLLQAVCHNL